MKKKFSYKDILFKSKRMAVLGLALVLGVGIAVTAGTDAGQEIPAHDGEVLVDSLAPAESGEAAEGAKDGAEDGSFEEARARLELDRNKLLANLDDTINGSDSENEKKNASEEKKRIMSWTEKELAIEQLIRSKNLPESLVIITENSISVTVDKQELDTNTVAKICDIVMRESGRSADKIIIQSKY